MSAQRVVFTLHGTPVPVACDLEQVAREVGEDNCWEAIEDDWLLLVIFLFPAEEIPDHAIFVTKLT